MNLEHVRCVVPLKIVRDAEFESLGFVTHSMPRMLVFLEQENFLPTLTQNNNISCIITCTELAEKIPAQYGLAIADNPRLRFYELHNYLTEKTDFYWKDFPSEISENAVIHPKACVAEKNVRIGRGTVLEAGAIILERSLIGKDVMLRAGCVVGSQGFQFVRSQGRLMQVAHAGGVKIGDRVEIQANSSISRPVFGGFTALADDSKLDNLVHIAHDVKIGKRCLIAACAMIAGSVTIGDDVWIGPSVSISSEIKIGDGANITIGSVVTHDVAPGQRVTGNFAIDHDKFISFIRSIR